VAHPPLGALGAPGGAVQSPQPECLPRP